MNFKNKELIIFDFDGTLIDSIPDLTIALNKMLSFYNVAPLTIKDTTPFVGNGAKLLVKRALEHSRKTPEISENFFNEAFNKYLSAYEEAICEETYLYPNVLETLNYLSLKGYKMAICTNKPFRFIEPILAKLNIKKLFKCWVGEDSLATKKPDAAPILHLVKKLKTVTEKCIMVGDSKNDILAAQNSGIESIGVSYGYNYNKHISDYNPTKVVDNFSELQELF